MGSQAEDERKKLGVVHQFGAGPVLRSIQIPGQCRLCEN